MLDINSSVILIDHHDGTTVDEMWYNKAYHWDRKSRYWRCTASAGDKYYVVKGESNGSEITRS